MRLLLEVNLVRTDKAFAGEFSSKDTGWKNLVEMCFEVVLIKFIMALARIPENYFNKW